MVKLIVYSLLFHETCEVLDVIGLRERKYGITYMLTYAWNLAYPYKISLLLFERKLPGAPVYISDFITYACYIRKHCFMFLSANILE